MHSLRSRLWVLWALATAAAIVVGFLLLQLYRTSSSAQEQRAEAVVARACDAIRDRFAFYAAGWNGADFALDQPGQLRDLAAVVTVALAPWPELAGGIWLAGSGSLTGTGAVTAAAQSLIREANHEASRTEQSALLRVSRGNRLLLAASCPLPSPISGLTGWTLASVVRPAGYGSLGLGLGVLAALVLGIALWLTGITVVWGRKVGQIEAALSRHDVEMLPELPATGERELDRIVAALNDAGRRLAAARLRSSEMTARIAAAERLAALGRMAAAVAHEIRNPMAAMRLRAENALAGDVARQRTALEASLVQIGRVDALIAELLTMTERREPHALPASLAAFVTARADAHRDLADTRAVSLSVSAPPATVSLDPALAGRSLDNLLLNAIQHTEAGGEVRVAAEVAGGRVRIEVADTGCGIPSDLRTRLFEPFATGRPEGTGLGLAIARELAEAHGGSLTLADAGGETPGRGARFVLDLPGGAQWPPS